MQPVASTSGRGAPPPMTAAARRCCRPQSAFAAPRRRWAAAAAAAVLAATSPPLPPRRLAGGRWHPPAALSQGAAAAGGEEEPGALAGGELDSSGSSATPGAAPGGSSAAPGALSGGVVDADGFVLPFVPWGISTVLQVMFLWLLSYLLVGHVFVPLVLAAAGVDRDELSSRGFAILHLGLDVSELAVTLAILWRCLAHFRPRAAGLFPLSLRGGWPLQVLAACAVFPAVDWLAQQSLIWFPTAGALAGAAAGGAAGGAAAGAGEAVWTTQLEASFVGGRDWVASAAYFLVVSLCAPVWEEAMFRGFLLASLTKFLSARGAVAVSSLLFALCHFRLQTFLPLLALGVVFALLFLRTRNLLPPILAHSLWNLYVLASLVLRPS